jgi:hypothetical protein
MGHGVATSIRNSPSVPRGYHGSGRLPRVMGKHSSLSPIQIWWIIKLIAAFEQVRRPFAWINSRMFVQRLKEFSEYTPDGEPVLDTFAEAQQIWHIWRRRYDLFLRFVLPSFLYVSCESPFELHTQGRQIPYPINTV